MLSSTGRSPRAGRASRPLAAWSTKSATVAMAERSETAQIGERLSNTILLTGQVNPQARTTVISARSPWRRALEGIVRDQEDCGWARGIARDSAAISASASRRGRGGGAMVRSGRERNEGTRRREPW